MELSLALCMTGQPCQTITVGRLYWSFEVCETEGDQIIERSREDLEEEGIRVNGFTCRLVQE